MELSQIQACLANSEYSQKLKALTELKNYEPEIAVPLLLSQIKAQDFFIRSLVAMGLGKKRTEESFAALLQMMKFDRDPNVRAEAANSLSMFGSLTVPHLVAAFYQDDSWLVRRSILAALMEFNCPDELFEVCCCGVNGDDLSVQEASVEGLGLLSKTTKQEEALSQLLLKVKDPSWRIRAKVARALSYFSSPQARAALQELKQDEDYRVVSSVLERVIEQ